MAWNTACGRRAGAPPSTVPSVTSTVGQRRRRVTGSATRSEHQPLSTSAWLSAVRAWPPMSTRGPFAGRPGEQDLARVRVRRARLGEEVVAVVEHRDQSEVGHRRERGTAGAQHDLHRAARHRQERPVPLGRLLRPGEDDVPALPQHRRERLVPPGDVAHVGHAHDAAPPGVQGRQRRLGDGRGRVVGRQRGPARPGPLPRREGGDERRAVRPRRPGVVGDGRQRASTGDLDGCASARACRGGTASRRTSLSVPAQRSATARQSPRTAGDSTGSAETTLLRNASVPSWSLVSTRSTTKASVRRPEKRTRTRQPGTTSASSVVGTR